ncbi:MAG: membrane dipeptidase [Bacteroidaceae bacterium]|nr:membrane dipeptidase [Bacteroidaceae bacterium]
MSRPVIGVTGNFGAAGCELAEGYYLSVSRAGAVPFIIPPVMGADSDFLDRILDGLDALVLSGGGDINPLLLGEEPVPELHSINVRRDRFELDLTLRAYQRQLPILGICRGIQVLAAALGGKLIQDIYTSTPKAQLKHSQDADRWCATHSVSLSDDSCLREIFGCERLAVNSFHHQAVGDAGCHLRVVASAPDGIIEAVESSERKPIIGVQWHPETFVLGGDESMMPLFRWLVDEAALYRRSLSLHDSIISLDSHEDTPMFFDQDINFGIRDERILVNLPNMDDGHLDCGIQVAYQPQGALDDASLLAATRRADALLDGIHAMVAPLSDRIRVLSSDEEVADLTSAILANKRAHRHSILLGIENGYAFGSDLANVERFRRRGVVYCTLCHNGGNQLCDSARPKEGDRLWGGLSPLGCKVVTEMNRVGMTIDLSHAAETTFYDVLTLSKRPVVCSHSNPRALCDHPRNLTDDQMRALAAKGGVMQLTLYHGFLRKEGEATIDDFMRHLEYAISVMGIDHVGIGSDFDGDGGVPGLANAADLLNITRQLLRRGFSDADITKIWSTNFLRVLENKE